MSTNGYKLVMGRTVWILNWAEIRIRYEKLTKQNIKHIILLFENQT